ncbi:LysR family transcriptional regulator [Sedimentitalea sp. JM2-8]|uniref:LysR family transcriptional regulator n=1 Tax=Sedimentitalea xiamensis TaxID=3050037 RepID=A0ABT7FBT6_9RHOB|nr:LysR family transcriptional regulator [Sedimentitalea xiamensis]MDK3072581.1 LysR family transcriptional regulator [Sedimentitalea xiamensis]
MITRNLRHFRVFLAVAELGTPTAAARRCRVSQPAVTQALSKLEREAGGSLFDRTRRGFFLTERGAALDARLRRAMHRLDSALADVAPRLTVTATTPQLQALIAVAEAQNVTLAARNLGLAQPTVHRAIARMEQEAAEALFERTSFGMVATRACRQIAQAARLAFSEFEQAEADLAEFDGREVGRIVVGSLPLSRSVVLPEALARFRMERPTQRVVVLDGPYDDLLRGLRRGDIDVMFGALRDPLPIDDVVQEPLFQDRLAVLARPGHPLAGAGLLSVELLYRQSWVVPRVGTQARAQFDALFKKHGLPPPESIIECGSILLMREILARTDLLGCISGMQADAVIENARLVRLNTGIDWPGRPIGLTLRAGWLPTRGQDLLLRKIRDAARSAAGL